MCVSAFAVVVGDSSLAQSSLSAPSLRTFTGSSFGVASAAHLGMVAAIHGQDHGYLLRNHAPTFVCSRLGERFIQKATVFMQKKMRHLYTCAYTYISHIYIYILYINKKYIWGQAIAFTIDTTAPGMSEFFCGESFLCGKAEIMPASCCCCRGSRGTMILWPLDFYWILFQPGLQKGSHKRLWHIGMASEIRSPSFKNRIRKLICKFQPFRYIVKRRDSSRGNQWDSCSDYYLL